MANNASKELIAERLRLTRIALGYTQQVDFSNELGPEITPQRWNNYESGRDRLTVNVALCICRRFPTVSLDWLYRGAQDTLPPRLSRAIDDVRKDKNTK